MHARFVWSSNKDEANSDGQQHDPNQNIIHLVCPQAISRIEMTPQPPKTEPL